MNPDYIIGVLAFVTIGAVLIMAIGHFGSMMRDPRHRKAAANVLGGGRSASTQAGIDAPGDTTLKERLDASVASQHPDDPALKPVSAH